MNHGMGSASVQLSAGIPLREFLVDPSLSVACVLLVVVSVGWIIVWRRILRDMRRAASRRPTRTDVVRPPRDIWSYPP